MLTRLKQMLIKEFIQVFRDKHLLEARQHDRLLSQPLLK